MKKLSYIIILFITICTISCKKNLNLIPLNNVTVSNFFKTEDDIKGFVNGLYQYMVPGQSTPYLDVPTDLFVVNPGRTDEAYAEFALGSYDATTGDVGLYWNYASIRNAYTFFQHINDVPMSNSSRMLYTGSVDYLLAYQYFTMFRAYESVPIVRSVLTLTDADIPSSSRDSVFAEALKWADSAVVNLPDLGPMQRERGKLTKLCALTLKTDMLLYASTRYQEIVPGATYKDAATAAEAAVKNAKAQGYGLATNYLDLFIASRQAGTDAQKEIILEHVRLPNIATEAYGISSYAFRPSFDGQGVNMFVPTQEFVNKFECTDGKPINKSTLYDPTHPFKDRDPRLTYTILYPGNVVNRVDGSSSWVSNTLDPSSSNPDYMLESSNSRNRPSTGYIDIKYWDRENSAQTAGYGSYITYRYAGLLLMFAEAENEAVGPDADVYNALTEVRQRVGMPAVTPSTNPTQASVRDLIRNERAVELAGEGKRYWDIRRWGTADSVLNKKYFSMHISKFNNDGSFSGYEPSIWVRTSLTDPTQQALFPIPNGTDGGSLITQYSFQSPRNYVWPIPQSAIDQSDGILKQNVLWK
jgi:hypothetical protein